MFDPDKHWLFPIVPGTKKPMWKWTERKMNRQEFNDWRAGDGQYANCLLGFATGERSDGIFVVDIDVGEGGQPSEQTLSKLLTIDWPEGCRSKTPSGGEHRFFRGLDDGNRAKVDGCSIDVRGTGGYVVLYPDVKQKDPYTHYDDWLVPDTTAQITEFITTPRPAVSNNLAIVDGARDDTLYRYACGLFGSGMSYDEVKRTVLLENQRAVPPLDPAQAVKCVDSARKYEQPLTPVKDISGIGYGETAAEFIAREYPPLPALCGPIQGGSMTVISGAHKAGKSLYALHVAAHVAAGVDMEDWIVPGAQETLYIDGENQSRSQHERMGALNFIKSDNFRIAHRDFLRENFGRFTLTDPACQEWLVNTTARLVVLDSLTALNPPDANTSINDVQFIESIMPAVDQLTSKGVAVLVLHNLNKSNTSHGTNALAWRSDRLWHLYRREGFKPGSDPPLKNHHEATAGMVLRALDGDRSLQQQAVDSEWQFFMGYGWRKD